MTSPLETSMLPRPAVVPYVAEMTEEEKRRHALMILDVVKRDITSEKLPPAIEKLITAYKRVGQTEHAILPQTIADNILALKGKVEDKLIKIQDERSIVGKLKNISDCVTPRFFGWVSNMCQQRITNGLQTTQNSSHLPPSRNQQQAWQEDAPVREEVAAAIQMVNASVMQSSQNMDYEMENGERVSEVVSLSRSVNCALETELFTFNETVRAADDFDRVCYSSFGFSFYSDEFGSFCSLMAATDQESDSTQLERFLATVESTSKREHMRLMSRDHNLRNQFSRLKTSVLKDHLYKIIALVFVNKILASIPVNYRQRSTELYLESLQLACDVFLQTQLTDYSSNRIREGIQNLMKNLHLINVCT